MHTRCTNMHTHTHAHTHTRTQTHTCTHKHTNTHTHIHTSAGVSAQIVGIVVGQKERLHLPLDLPPSDAAYADLTMRCLSYDVRQRPSTDVVLQALEGLMVGGQIEQ